MSVLRSGHVTALLLSAFAFGLAGCGHVEIDDDNHEFPKSSHSLLPTEYGWGEQEDSDVEWRTSVGRVEQPVDEQPIECTMGSSVECDDGEGFICDDYFSDGDFCMKTREVCSP